MYLAASYGILFVILHLSFLSVVLLISDFSFADSTGAGRTLRYQLDWHPEIKHVTRTPRCDHFPTKWNLALIENMLHADSEKLGLLDLICGINEHVTKVFLSCLSDQCGIDEHASGKNIPSARYPDFHNKNTNLSQNKPFDLHLLCRSR